MSSERIERRARVLSGLPRVIDPTRPWWKRLLRNPWTWITLALFISYGLAMWHMYFETSGNLKREIEAVTKQIGSPAEVTQSQVDEALLGSMKYAAYTLAAYVGLFFLIDRIRPTRFILKIVALGWGAAIATLVSLYLNSWVSSLIRIEGPVDNTSASRAAVFVAPFVEEAAKATILFLLAMAIRYRFVTIFQSITLAGLSAVGFAFTENIIYYSRPYLYASKIFGTDPEAARNKLVVLRGVVTSWGHPLFTSATAIGLIVALRARSKFVRIVAPLTGFVFAAFGHMSFNGLASTGGSLLTLLIGGGILLLSLAFWLFRKVKAERLLMSVRLTDFVQMGWLEPHDEIVFTRFTARFKLGLAALLRGPRVFCDTIGLQRSITELAYLRSMMTLGTVDGIGDERLAELLALIRMQRINGLSQPEGLRLKPDNWHLPRFSLLERFRKPKTAALAKQRAQGSTLVTVGENTATQSQPMWPIQPNNAPPTTWMRTP